MKLPKLPKSDGVTYDEILEASRLGTMRDLCISKYDTVAGTFSGYLDSCSDRQLGFIRRHFDELLLPPNRHSRPEFTKDAIQAIDDEMSLRMKHRDTEEGIRFFFEEIKKLQQEG